ncbi:hypothetical protein AVEN_19241-1 [Araneus ventricosus]|uniref:Uncharacterized protein n=1 Tax=Araneus ventricosus TaxID=182803 RepID=A0A4Y2R0J6_ARAVE|nr:hypothetical protein AVEN_19241-1 [Araneus ventricosus]
MLHGFSLDGLRLGTGQSEGPPTCCEGPSQGAASATCEVNDPRKVGEHSSRGASFRKRGFVDPLCKVVWTRFAHIEMRLLAFISLHLFHARKGGLQSFSHPLLDWLRILKCCILWFSR